MQDQHQQQKLQSERRRGDIHHMSQTENHLRVSLEELNDKVSRLKSLIPFSLVKRKTSESEPSSSHHHRPKPQPRPPRKHVLDDHVFKSDVGFFTSLPFTEKLACHFFVAFPENTVIKKSLLHNFMDTVLSKPAREWLLMQCKFNMIIDDVLKRGTKTLAGYLVNPLARTRIQEELSKSFLPNYPILVTGNVDDEEIIPNDLVVESSDSSSDWERSSTFCAEMDDLHLSFTCVCTKKDRLKYLSLRGNSKMRELPECITKLDKLQTLSLEDCQNLVVISSKIIDHLGGSLTSLDMSGCYSLVHMPPALAQLHKLRVLKGFVIRQAASMIKEDVTCTLEDLARGLRRLEKLNISTNAKGFPNESDFVTLQEFRTLYKLTISWEGYAAAATTSAIATAATKKASRSETPLTSPDHSSSEGEDFDNRRLNFKLEKLDLQCAPSGISYSWLKPSNFPALHRLYIRGGQLDDLRQKPPL